LTSLTKNAAKSTNSDTSKNTDDGNNDKQFDQSKTSFFCEKMKNYS